MRDAVFLCVDEDENDLRTVLSDDSLYSFVKDVVIIHGVKRYLHSPTSNLPVSFNEPSGLGKMDQTLFQSMSSYFEHLPVHKVGYNVKLRSFEFYQLSNGVYPHTFHFHVTN